LKMKRLSNSVLGCSMSSSKFIQAAVWNIKDYMNMTHPGQGLPKHASGLFPSGYVPKLHMLAELNDKEMLFYQSQLAYCIGVLS
jgi:hypothetical protein